MTFYCSDLFTMYKNAESYYKCEPILPQYKKCKTKKQNNFVDSISKKKILVRIWFKACIFRIPVVKTRK